MEGLNCLELSTNILEATNCLKPMISTLAHTCYIEIYTSLFPNAFFLFKLEIQGPVHSSHKVIKYIVSWPTKIHWPTVPED